MTKRYYSSTPITASVGASLRLEDPESHHFLQVMRGKVGDEIILFDGSDQEIHARAIECKKRDVLVEILARNRVRREPESRLHLGVALPKGERQQWLCEKLVELGCAELTPLITKRGVAEPVDAALLRLRRTVIEASKQCGRNTLMAISPPQSLRDFLSDGDANSPRLFLDASGEPFPTASEPSSAPTWLAAVGPEGGWSEEELTFAREFSWRPTSLGSRILRVETAAIAFAARICVD